MANLPEARRSPTSARPSEIVSPVPSEELSSEEIDTIRKNLSGMDTETLDKFFTEKGLSKEEQDAIRSVLQPSPRPQISAAQQEEAAMAQPKYKAVSVPATPENPYGIDVSERTVPPAHNLKPTELLQSLGQMGKEMLPGLFADIPSAAVGLGTTRALSGLGVPATAAIPAGALMGGLTAIAGSSEGFENVLRESIGLEPKQYQWWETSLAAAGGAGSVINSMAKEIKAAKAGAAGEETIKAVKGAAALRKGANDLAEKWGIANNLTKDQMMSLTTNVDEFWNLRIEFYKGEMGLNDYDAAKRALGDISDYVQEYNDLNKALNLADTLDEQAMKVLMPSGWTKWAEETEKASKIRASEKSEEFFNLAQKEVEKQRKLKSGYSEGLFVPTQEIKSALESEIEQAATILTPVGDPSTRMIYKDGNWLVKKGEKIIPVTAKEDIKAINNAVKANPHLKELVSSYVKIQQLSPRVGVRLGKPVLSSPEAISLDELGNLRKVFSTMYKGDSTVNDAIKSASRKTYGLLTGIENKYLGMVENGKNVELAQAAKKYRESKDLSEASASLFQEVSAKIKDNPELVSNAFLALDETSIKNFLKLSRNYPVEEFGEAIINKQLPETIAMTALQSKFKSRLFAKASQYGGLGKDLINSLPDVIQEIERDSNLRNKMGLLLGDKNWDAMLSQIRKTSDFAKKELSKIDAARRSGNLQAENTVIAAAGTKMGELAAGAGSVGGAGALGGVSRIIRSRQFLITKLIAESMGVPAVTKKVNQIIFSKYMDDVVSGINTTSDAIKMRKEIVDAFGFNTYARKILQNFDTKAYSVLKAKADAQAALGVSAAGGLVRGAMNKVMPQQQQTQE